MFFEFCVAALVSLFTAAAYRHRSASPRLVPVRRVDRPKISATHLDA